MCQAVTRGRDQRPLLTFTASNSMNTRKTQRGTMQQTDNISSILQRKIMFRVFIFQELVDKPNSTAYLQPCKQTTVPLLCTCIYLFLCAVSACSAVERQLLNGNNKNRLFKWNLVKPQVYPHYRWWFVIQVSISDGRNNKEACLDKD